jgi:rhamnosyltransferase
LRLHGIPPSQVLILDAGSTDGTPEFAVAEGYQALILPGAGRSTAAARQRAIDYVPWASLVVFLAQDAVLATPDAIDRLIAPFADPTVAASFGRQLPCLAADPVEAHARLFDYPPKSDRRTLASRRVLGVKAATIASSFAAYRISSLERAGGLPTSGILREDILAGARILLKGWTIAYVAEAEVFHSRLPSLSAELGASFDRGVFDRMHAWLFHEFGRPLGEGRRFFLSELDFLARNRPHKLPFAIVRAIARALSHQLGLRHQYLGRALSRRLSGNKPFWDRANSA